MSDFNLSFFEWALMANDAYRRDQERGDNSEAGF